MTATRSSQDTINKVQTKIANDLPKLSPHLRAWAESHLITPKVVSLFADLDSSETEDYWQVTGTTGQNDSSYRVIYTEDLDTFGLAMRTQEGRNCCMGFYGDFAKTINSM